VLLGNEVLEGRVKEEGDGQEERIGRLRKGRKRETHANTLLSNLPFASPVALSLGHPSCANSPFSACRAGSPSLNKLACSSSERAVRCERGTAPAMERRRELRREGRRGRRMEV
jgi:hypothetical protein